MYEDAQHSQFTARSGGGLETALDAGALHRQTMGDAALQTEVLQLFRRQARALMARFEAVTDPAARADIAHTIKGAARGVGAWRVAVAADALENAARAREPMGRELAELAETVAEASAAIELKLALR